MLVLFLVAVWLLPEREQPERRIRIGTTAVRARAALEEGE